MRLFFARKVRPHYAARMTKILGHISTTDFLTEYWQRRPLLVGQAIPDFTTPLDAQLLAGFSLEPGIRSRIVVGGQTNQQWQCHYGPFDEGFYQQLPASHWTLLVQDMEKHMPGLQDIVDRFCFLPRWRIDDLMISYATDGGSVGPHTDQYDVFLIQASGKRKWQIQENQVDPENLVEDIELSILRDFQPENEWILEPGDMLYLPPGVAHHGVAIGECMTFSIGFRAPSRSVLLHAIAEQISGKPDVDRFYTDPRPTQSNGRAELTGDQVNAMIALMRDGLHDSHGMKKAIGSLLTEPVETPALYEAGTMSFTEFSDMLIGVDHFTLHPATRCLYMTEDDSIRLYVNATEYPVKTQSAEAIVKLADEFSLPHDLFRPLQADEHVMAMLYELHQQGYLKL